MLPLLSRYGAPLGEAFQVRDDLEGVARGDPDLAQARPTVLLAKARELASDAERAFLDERLGRGTLPADDRRRVIELLRDTGALEAAAELANGLIDEALRPLDPGVLGGGVAEALGALANVLRVPSD